MNHTDTAVSIASKETPYDQAYNNTVTKKSVNTLDSSAHSGQQYWGLLVLVSTAKGRFAPAHFKDLTVFFLALAHKMCD